MGLLKQVQKIIWELNEPDLLVRLAKLQEEAGELSATVLKSMGHKPCGPIDAENNFNNLREEAVDVLITALAIIAHLKMSKREVNGIARIALGKFANAIDAGQIKKYEGRAE